MVTSISDFCRFMLLTEVERTYGGCWTWLGNKPDDRYGHFTVDGKAVKAHRWIYEKVVGPIPTGLLIRHKCDNPQCVNPDHLEPGTSVQNTTDMIERGRGANRQGERHPLARLTPDQVLEIRRLRECGYPETAVAKQFNIGRGQVGKIHRRENWSHL